VATLPSVASVLRYDVVWSNGSDANVESRLFFKYAGGPPSNADCAALASDAFTHIGANLMPNASTDCVLVGVRCTDLTSPSSGFGIHEGSTAGSGSGNPLAGGVAVLFNYTIARRYRGGKPRNYMPLGTSTDLTNPTNWTTGFISTAGTAIGNTITAILGDSSGSTTLINHVNVSYYDGVNTASPPWRGPGFKYPRMLRGTPVVDAITSSACNPKPGSQRRRYQR